MRKRAVLQYLLLALIMLPAFWIEAGSVEQLIHLLRKAPEMTAPPFSIKAATREIGSGEYQNNQLLAIGGRPFNDPEQLGQKIRAMRPGQPLTMLMSEPNGNAIERTVMLPPMVPAGGVGLTRSVLWITLDAVIPTLAMLLGATVVLLRPRDLNAWLLLLMLLGFSEIARAHELHGPLPGFIFAWSAFGVASWPIWMMLFGIYFPERLSIDRRYPALKYLVLIPCALCPLAYWTIIGIWRHDVNRSLAWRGLLMKLTTADILISMLAISVFFASIGHKSGVAASPDTRRRMGILWLGCSLSLSPMLATVIYATVSGRDIFDGVPFYLVALVLMALLLFPATLVYVIVIERAMDLSFVIRQSVQYGLLKAGLWTARVAVVVMLGYLLAIRGLSASPLQGLQLAGVTIAALAVMGRSGADRASRWIDRRFFREAYDSERILADLAVEAGRFVERKPLLDTVAKRLSDTLHVPEITILLRNDSVFETEWSTRAGEPLSLPANSEMVKLLWEQGKPLQIFLEPPSPWLARLDATELQAIGVMRSQLLLPMAGKDRLAGILSLGPKLSEVPYSSTDIRLLQSVAAQVGLALENSRLAESLAAEAAQRERLNREVEIAREVQQRLFPQSYPPVCGVEYFGYCRPALIVGGDYYDFLHLPNGSFGIAIGDISGKGIAASLLMASLQASLRGQTIVDQRDLSRLMRNINKLVFEASTSNRYATFFYGEYNPHTREFHFVNAGHNAPIILRGEQVVRLEAGGPVVGLLPSADFEQGSAGLLPGDIFLAFTDGISEAMNADDEEWEEERFIAAAKSCSTLPACDMIQQIFKAADAFVDGAEQHDDMTLIVAKLSR